MSKKKKLKEASCSSNPVQYSIDPIKMELKEQRSEVSRCYGMIDELVQNNDAVANERDKLQQTLRVTEAENKHLWNEIEKLRHGYDGLDRLRQFYQKELGELRIAIKDASSIDVSQLPAVGVAPKISDFKSSYSPDLGVVPHFYSGLDVPESHINTDSGEMIHLGGWCFDDQGRAPKRVWVEVGKQSVPCSIGWKRSDVVEEFQGTLVADLHCGFNVELTASSGVNALNVRAEFQSGAEVSLFNRNIVKVGSDKPRQGQLEQDYGSWVEMFDTLTRDDERLILEHINQFKDQPLISILLPTYNTDERWLAEVIESVRKQLYSNWELCIADDCSPDPHVKSILEYYAGIDDRIKVTIRTQNGHISAATNTALELATGRFCALLDHDDVIPAHALYYVAWELNQYPETDLIFSDEDKIDERGNRFDPYFKSDWNPELFCSHNCISHLGVYKTSILREIGGFKEELFGSQDWDLAFRFIQHAGDKGVRHIPRVLYHWRYLESSTAMSIESKPYALTAGKRAIENYLKVKGSKGEVLNGMWPGAFRVKYHLDRLYKVTIIIDTHDFGQLLDSCLASLFSSTEYTQYEVLVIQSDVHLAQLCSRHPEIQCIQVDGGNQAQRYNEAAKKATGDVIVILDVDTKVTDPGWLNELVSQASQGETGAVGPWLQYPDGKTHSAGFVFVDQGPTVMKAFRGLPQSDIGHMGRAHLIQRFKALSSVCLAIRRTVFEELGGFNEALDQTFDLDFCLRLKNELGLHCVWTPYAKIEYLNLFKESDILESEKDAFSERWTSSLNEDEYFNPNLDLKDPRFFLAWPPRLATPWQEI